VQALDEDIARQRGRYDEGYEVLRQRRFAAWKAAGFAPRDGQLPNLPPDYKPWGSLSSDEKAKSARAMEVYAAMVERMDSEIGRVLRYLEISGQLNNTLIMFQSDNGAEGMEGFGGGGADNRLENIGHPGSWAFIGRGWAEAGSAPFYLQKYSTAEGGIHVPAIVSAPALGIPVGRRDDSVLIASDNAPTFLELAGADLAAPSNRPDALPITGRSFAGVMRGNNRLNKRGADDVLGWEHSGNAAIRKGDWKLLWVGRSMLMGGGGPPAPGGATGPMPPPTATTRTGLEAGGVAGEPVGNGGPWMLFNLHQDPAELHDLSQTRPEVMAQMLSEWNRYVVDNGVIVKKGTAVK
jgi:arylsulfatase